MENGNVMWTQMVKAILQTLLTEVERVLNRRALTAYSDDPYDLWRIAPSHSIMQRKAIAYSGFVRNGRPVPSCGARCNFWWICLEEVIVSVSSIIASKREMVQSFT